MKRSDLVEQIRSKNSFLSVGLDSDLSKIPTHLLREPDPILAFNKVVIDASGVTTNGLRFEGNADKQKFIGSLLYTIIGLSIVLAGLIILFFSRTIIKDITNLTKATNKISQGELDFQLPEIKSKNEFYELNEGLKSVVAAVEFLKDVAAEKNNGQNK